MAPTEQQFRRPLDKLAQLRYDASEKAALRRIAEASWLIALYEDWRDMTFLTTSQAELVDALADYETRFGGLDRR